MNSHPCVFSTCSTVPGTAQSTSEPVPMRRSLVSPHVRKTLGPPGWNLSCYRIATGRDGTGRQRTVQDDKAQGRNPHRRHSAAHNSTGREAVRQICTQGVAGSNPAVSTIALLLDWLDRASGLAGVSFPRVQICLSDWRTARSWILRSGAREDNSNS